MLKWAVNGSRQTYLQTEENNLEFPDSLQRQKTSLWRKSSDLSLLKPKHLWPDKENQYTSTPLQASHRRFPESPTCKTATSLIDLSNIVPEQAPSSPLKLSAHKKTSKILNITETVQKNFPLNYAPTLPTFDVEYSPSALIPGPMLALRGVGIPDSYFEKPRYITPHIKPAATKKHLEEPIESVLKYPTFIEESTLSSTKMGDITLERMIDAILESNHKEGKPQKPQKHLNQQQSNMSPTYTPGDDPASDLQEIWDSDKARYRQKEQKFRTRLTKKSLFTERELGYPHLEESWDPGQLRRQRGLRRKRKINQITASVVSSAQKLLGKGLQAHTLCSTDLPKAFKAELMPPKLLRNISPDSGHNSSSDYEEEQHVTAIECLTNNNNPMDNTKRRLSFSLQNLNEL